jgi:WD40 repeat protein
MVIRIAILGGILLLGGGLLAAVALSGRGPAKQSAQVLDVARHPEPAQPDAPKSDQLEVPISLPAEGEKPLLVLDAGAHTANVKKVLFTPDGERLVTVSMDKTARVYDLATGETVKVFRVPIGPGNEGALLAGAISPDGRILAVSGQSIGNGALGTLIYLINLQTGRVERVLKGHSNVVFALAFSPDGKRLASASPDQSALVYDLAAGKVEHALTGHRSAVVDLAFSPDSKRLATASDDHTARLWSLATGAVEAELRGHTDKVISVAWSSDGKTIATGGVEGAIRLWEPDGTPRATFPFPRKAPVQPTSLTFTRDGSELLYTGVAYTGHAGILDATTGKRIGWSSPATATR